MLLRTNRPGAKVSQGLKHSVWLQGMPCGTNAAYEYIKAFSETDQFEDLKKFDVPTLVLHGDDQDSSHWRSGHAVIQDRKGRSAEGLSGRTGRHAFDAER